VEVTMTEMATGKMAVAAEMTTTEMTTAEVTTAEVTATMTSEGGGGRERSDSDESKGDFAKHF
jgi:hypothetical protein